MIILKIGRNEYEITDKDQFMDNGVCIQLLTQSKERSEWGRKPNPVLSKRAISDISKFKRVKKGSLGTAFIFSLELETVDK